jgi:hypothetical protein
MAAAAASGGGAAGAGIGQRADVLEQADRFVGHTSAGDEDIEQRALVRAEVVAQFVCAGHHPRRGHEAPGANFGDSQEVGAMLRLGDLRLARLRVWRSVLGSSQSSVMDTAPPVASLSFAAVAYDAR